MTPAELALARDGDAGATVGSVEGGAPSWAMVLSETRTM